MLTQITKVAQLEVTDTTLMGLIHFIVMNDDVEVNRANHRFALPYEYDPRTQLDYVNNHLIAMGQQPMSEADITRILLIFDTAKQVSPNAPVSG